MKRVARTTRGPLKDAFSESRFLAKILLFPYFLPLVALSTCTTAWVIVDPDRSDFFGISGDVIGLFIVACLSFATIAQILVGIPFNFLLAWIRAPFCRALLALAGAALSLIPFHGDFIAFRIAIAICCNWRLDFNAEFPPRWEPSKSGTRRDIKRRVTSLSEFELSSPPKMA